MLTPEQAAKVVAHLKLANGFMQTAEGSALSSEYAIRNSISRLYYAFFHASLALLHTVQSDVERLSRNHGNVHKEVEKRIGKPIGGRLRRLAEFRRRCDYEPDLFQKKYGGNIEEARNEAKGWLKSSRGDFYWIYHEARKELKNQ